MKKRDNYLALLNFLSLIIIFLLLAYFMKDEIEDLFTKTELYKIIKPYEKLEETVSSYSNIYSLFGITLPFIYICFQVYNYILYDLKKTGMLKIMLGVYGVLLLINLVFAPLLFEKVIFSTMFCFLFLISCLYLLYIKNDKIECKETADLKRANFIVNGIPIVFVYLYFCHSNIMPISISFPGINLISIIALILLSYFSYVINSSFIDSQDQIKIRTKKRSILSFAYFSVILVLFMTSIMASSSVNSFFNQTGGGCCDYVSKEEADRRNEERVENFKKEASVEKPIMFIGAVTVYSVAQFINYYVFSKKKRDYVKYLVIINVILCILSLVSEILIDLFDSVGLGIIYCIAFAISSITCFRYVKILKMESVKE